jgi:hypothetical protein
LKQPVPRTAIEYTIRHECGTHFEAVLGAGEVEAARAFWNELVEFRPTCDTFKVLVHHALRAGAREEAGRIEDRGRDLLPAAERGCLDERAQ